VRETNLKVIHSVACSSRIGLLVAFISITHQPCRWRVGVLLHLATAGSINPWSLHTAQHTSILCFLLVVDNLVSSMLAKNMPSILSPLSLPCTPSQPIGTAHKSWRKCHEIFYSTPLEQQATPSISPVAIDNNWSRYHKRVAQLEYVRLVSVRR
jgi:hypothetical protein